MATSAATPVAQSQSFSGLCRTNPQVLRPNIISFSLKNPSFQFTLLSRRHHAFASSSFLWGTGHHQQQFEQPHRSTAFIASATTTDTPKKRYPGESKGFVEEMRFVAMKLHTRDQAKEGEKESDTQPIGKWEPTVEGYLRFLVDSKLVYDTLEGIVRKASHPWYAEFRNTGLERSEKLARDLAWFKEQGHAIPEASPPGTDYAHYLEDLSEDDPQAFICHFYNVYFAHSAGGRMIGKKVAEKILDNKELEFYKWDGELSELLQNVRDKLNEVANSWSREEKDHCLEETENSFKYSGQILRLILS